MKILVLGSGLLGVTSAYVLAGRGHSVTVVDRRSESGVETSFANGGQLSYSHGEPWAAPHILPKLPKWLLDPSSPLVVRPRADWHMVRWGLQFLRNCTAERARVNCETLLRIGLYSKEKFQAISEESGIAFDYSATGILYVYRAQADFDHDRRQNQFQMSLGCPPQRELSRDECLSLEPTLAHSHFPIVGGLHVDDECGDAYLFCRELTKAAEKRGVTFLHGTTVKNLRAENGRIASVETSRGELQADAYVMALGSYSPLYLRRIGIDIPVYPMKGYSVTLPANEFSPNLSVSDGSHKIVVTRLGDRIRVAGTAEFAGYNDAINEKRIAPIVKAAKALFPKARWDNITHKWACLRAMTPDGPPTLGGTRYANLFLNTGHGTLGWTQAAGSAYIVADIIEGRPPEIIMKGLTGDGR